MVERSYNTIIVGGGMAGLTAGTYIAKEGLSVLIIEKNNECGGLVNSFERDGFHFEAGIRALENAGIIFPMLKELGIQLEVVESSVSVGIENEIMHVRDEASLEEYSELLKKFYPGSGSDIDHLLKIIRKVMKEMDVLYGVENPNFKDMFTDREYLFKELLPWLPKFISTMSKINRMDIPVEDYLEDVITDPALRDIITQHFFRNTPAFFALSYFSLYLDYFYPRGGVGQLAKVVEERYREFGGEIRNKTLVTGVDAQRQIITDQDGNQYSYDQLVWAADLKTFYEFTSTKGLNRTIRTKFEKEKSRLLVRRGGDSVFTLYLQVDEAPERFQEIAHGHFFYTPSTMGLGATRWSDLDGLLAKGDGADRKGILAWLDKFIALNTFEISIPVLKDPELAPEGKTGVIVSILADYDLYKLVADAGWYKEFVKETEERIIRVLTDSVYPMLKDKVIGRFSFSPLSYASRVASSEGAITGWSFREPIPVVHRIHQANRAVKTPIPSIFQAGQWTYSPAGVPMSILTGKLAAKKVIKSNKYGY